MDEFILYSTSPIYGVAGIWRFDPKTEANSKLITVGKNAYVELLDLDVSAGRLRYYYAPHVDSVKFDTFRDGTKNLRLLDFSLR